MVKFLTICDKSDQFMNIHEKAWQLDDNKLQRMTTHYNALQLMRVHDGSGSCLL